MKDFVCLILTWKMMIMLLANVLSAMGLVACLMLICFAQNAAQHHLHLTPMGLPLKTMKNRLSLVLVVGCPPARPMGAGKADRWAEALQTERKVNNGQLPVL